MKAIRIALGALVLSAVAALGVGHAQSPTTTLTVDLKAQNGSNETGTAALTQKPEGVEVVITLANAPASAQPAHIHPGTCADLNPAPKYPLTSVAGGNSTTIVKGVTIDQLLANPMAINVHKSTSDLATYVACGDIKVATP
jgi:Cu/Zn superoxide dismutase